LSLVVGTAIADEIFGFITKVDVEGKKLSVETKDSDTPVEITVNDDTELVTAKGSSKVDLEKLAKNVERIKEKGKKGIPAKITHDKNVASKISVAGKKKADPKN
jgi:biopolymer transport protein ExbD